MTNTDRATIERIIRDTGGLDRWIKAFGWQGGTIHQIVETIYNTKAYQTNKDALIAKHNSRPENEWTIKCAPVRVG